MNQDKSGLLALESLLSRDLDTDKLDRGLSRFALFLEGMLNGYEQDLTKSLGNLMQVPENYQGQNSQGQGSQEITAGKISFISVCEHHLVPFFGEVRVSYVPDSKICGYGGLFNVINALSRRLQLQERLTHEIAHFLYTHLAPKRICVQIRAKHLCTALKEGSRSSILETKVVLGQDLADN